MRLTLAILVALLFIPVKLIGSLLRTALATTEYRLEAVIEVEEVRDIEWSYDGSYLAVASGSDVLLFETGSYEMPFERLSYHTDYVTDIAFSPVENLIASSSADKTLRIWDLETHQTVHVLQSSEIVPGELMSVGFSSDGAIVLGGVIDTIREVIGWDVQSGDRVRVFGDTFTSPIGIEPNPSNSELAITSGPELRVVNLDNHDVYITEIDDASLSCPIYNNDGTLLAVGADYSDDQGLYVWDLNGNRNKSVFIRPQRVYDSFSGRCSLDFHPQQNIIAFADNDGQIVLMELNENTITGMLEGHEGFVWSIVFHPGGDILASSGFEDNTVKIWRRNSSQN